MKEKAQEIWNRIINSGTSGSSRHQANKKIRLTNIALIVSAIALNAFSVLNWYLGFIELVLLDTLISLLALLCVFLNAKKKFKLAHMITFGLLPAIFFIYPYCVGNIGSEYYYFFFLVVGYYILDNKPTILVYSFYIFLLFVGSKYFIYHNHFQDKYLILETVHYYPSIIASVIMVVVATYVFKNDTQIYQREVELKNTQLEQIKEEVREKNMLLQERNTELRTLNNDLTSSISYASHLQNSILISESELSKYFSSIFILNKPKDIVSGDFYWYKNIGDVSLLALIDCTGHGVPGAFMTAMTNTMLNEIVLLKIYSPSDILNELCKKLSTTFNINGSDNRVKDGMEIAICAINKKNQQITFAGSKRPLFQIRNGELFEHKSSKTSIESNCEVLNNFESVGIDIQAGDRFYMFTDGYPDQFGGKTKRVEKLMIKNFRKILIDAQEYPLGSHKDILLKSLEAWQGNESQIDDILIIGFEV